MKKIHDFDEVFDGQKVFRKILEAMSNPGRFMDISEEQNKMFGENKAFLMTAMTLLDNETSFYTCGDEILEKDISMLTLSKSEQLENADFVFVGDGDRLEQAVEGAKCGTLIDPHKSATLIIKTEGSPDQEINLHGPGIDGVKTILVTDTVTKALKLRDDRHDEYPQGIDLIFVTASEQLLCLPRLVRREG